MYNTTKPNENEPKTPEWYLKTAKYYHSMWSNGNTFVNSSGFFNSPVRKLTRSIAELRAHGRGVQNVSKYKDIIDPVIKKGRRAGKRRLNISWDTVKILPKFRRIVWNKFDEIIMIPVAQAYDGAAQFERERKKNYMKISVSPATQMMTEGNNPELEVDNQEDIDFLSKTGGIEIPVEIGIKDAIDASLRSSDFEVVKDMWITDVIDLNSFAYDMIEKNGVLQPVYVDFDRVIAKPSIYPDFRDSEYRGYISFRTVSDILQEASGLRPDQIERIKKAAQMETRTYNNDGSREDFMHHTRGQNEGCDVLKMYFIVYEQENYVVGKHRSGTSVFEKIASDFKLSDRELTSGRKKLETYSIGYLYQLNWVVDTDVTYNCGKVDVIVRGGVTKAKIKFPMGLFSGHEPSFIENCISSDDDLQLAVFKLRNTLRKIPPGPRMIVYKDLLADYVEIGKEKVTVQEMTENFMREGLGIFATSGEYNLPGEDGRPRSPFEFVATGALEDVQLYRNEIREAVEFIRQQTGLNEAADGTTTRSDMLNGVMDALQNVASAANRPYMKLFVRGYESMCDYIGTYYQIMTLSGEKELVVPGEVGSIRKVRLEGNYHNYDLFIGVKVESPERLQYLRQLLNTKLEKIPEESFFLIESAINDGDLRKAQFLMARFVKKANEQVKQDQIEIQSAVGKSNAQAAMQAEKAKQETEMFLNQMKKDYAVFEADIKERAADEQLRRDKEKKRDEIEFTKEKELEIVRANNTNRLQQ